MLRDLISRTDPKSDERNRGTSNESELAKFDAILDEAQQSLNKAKRILGSPHGAEVAQLKKNLAELVPSLESTLYGSAIRTFIRSMDTSHRTGSIPDDEYARISPIPDKWRALVDGAPLGEASFREFQADLSDFSKAYPNWIDEGVSLASWFSSTVWDGVFKARHERVTRLTQQIMTLLGQRPSSSIATRSSEPFATDVRSGETARIVEIHPDDDYFSQRHIFIGQLVIVRDPVHHGNGWHSANVAFHSAPLPGMDGQVFARVRFQRSRVVRGNDAEATDMSDIGELETSYTVRGLPRYAIRVSHSRLHRYQAVRGSDPLVVSQRAQALAAQWDEIWGKRKERETAARDIEEKKRIAVERTQEARQAIEQIRDTLRHALNINNTINWKSLKGASAYPVPKPVPPIPPPPLEPRQALPEPQPDWPVFQPRIGLTDRLIPSRGAARRAEAQAAFQRAHEDWMRRSQEQEREHEIRLKELADALRMRDESHRRAVAEWEEHARRFAQEQAERNAALDQKRDRYLASDVEAISGYCGMVLDNSSYPDCFPKSFELDHNPANRVLIVDYQFPAPTGIPAVTEVKYVQATDEFTEKRMSQGQLNQLYDSLLYQIALRTIHELYEADAVSALESVVFNGWVHSVDPSTGQETDACVLSVQASKEEFLALNLSGVDPRACFKKLKGVGSARLHSLVPVRPLLTLLQEDRRFVASYGVADSLSEVDNLAAMDWEDFEHLIRELFEKEFSAVGGEVKVTRASRDGGVDAVIFDPDPLRGGKTVIQAKRYTNTVGVGAVRDLYGTVLNEGANKGILVTTSDFGPDAYDFAKGKPLVLLNGGNLLHLLERHGHKAKIDIHEAKRLLEEHGSP